MLRLDWGETNGTLENSPHWKLNCRVPRERNLQTEVQVIGDHADNSQRLHLDSLHQMLQSFCELWPIDAVAAPGTINIFAPQPPLMTPTAVPIPQMAASGEPEKRVA